MDLSYSFKGYLINLHQLSDDYLFKNILINLNKGQEIIKSEEVFNPTIKEINFSERKNKEEYYHFPFEFVLVTEKLFDRLFNQINSIKYNKDNYKYNAILGDNALFIQDKNFNEKFYVYEFIKGNNLRISFLFRYNYEKIFYNEVKAFIKDKGIINYIIEKKMNLRNIGTPFDLTDKSDHKIGEYICYKKLDDNEINKIRIKNNLHKNKKIFDYYKEFIKKLLNLNDKKIKITNINDILNMQKNNLIVDYKPVIIILYNHMNFLKESLFFRELEELSEIKDEKRYKEKEEIIIDNLSNSAREDINVAIKKIKLFNSSNISSFMKGKYSYALMNLEFIEKIYDSKEELNKLQPLEGYFFINNNEYFIFFSKMNKLFNLENKNENEFYLNEYEFNKDLKNVLKNLKLLNQIERYIKSKIKTKLKNIQNPEYFNLINKNWITDFKKFYNYNAISQNIDYEDKELFSFLNNSQNFPNDLMNQNNIYPKNFKYTHVDFNIPINFELVDNKLFESILKDINTKNNINLNVNNKYQVTFGDNKAFIQDISNNKLIFIYSYKNNNYEIEYIILDESNINLLNLLKYFHSFEEFTSDYGIDLSKTEPQIILDKNLKKLGDFYNINPKQIEIRLREPNHCLGLENIGATCYMNATIQCLCNVLNMKQYFQNRQFVYRDTNNKNCPLTREFYDLLNSLWKDSSNGKKYFTPKNFKNRISEMNPLFQGIAANDSKDLIIFLYETIHNEINNPNQYNPNNNNNQDKDLQIFRRNYYSNNSSFLIDTFYFEQQSLLGCFNCRFNKISYNISNIFIFPLEKVREYMVKKSPNGFWSVTLENCFENYQEPEILSGQNQIYCNNCYQNSNAKTQNKIFTSPEVMTIILNRGKGLEFQVEFEYPLEININKFVVDKSNNNNNYELICVLTHIGQSSMAGHFIAFCKSPVDRKWYCYNDASVFEIDDPRYQNNDQIDSIPYVLYYQKMDQNKKIDNIEKNESYNVNKNFNYMNASNKIYNKGKYNKYNNNNKNKSVYNNIHSDEITLLFQYDEKEVYLDVKKSKSFKEILNKLTSRYKNIPNDVMFYIFDGNGLKQLKFHKCPNDYHLKNNTPIIAMKV